MLQYKFSYHHPYRHFIDIEFHIDQHQSPELILQLPSWRPGRYELGNFAKNIQYFKVHDIAGNPLDFIKNSKDSWCVSTPHIHELVVSYNYYAYDLNAGSTYLDEKQFFVNPVNCCLYIPNRINEGCQVNIYLPKDYKIACALGKESQFLAQNFNELVESPWIASKSIQHKKYQVHGIDFYVWFQGECSPDWEVILNDFKAFTLSQINDFDSFPVKKYHFINQIVPYKAYHGVEHTASTIIYLGPGDQLMSKDLYASLLGVSSHELYHTWNIKQIRPNTLISYDYTKENYSRMGYLYEGVTTYMGDLYLIRSKVFSIQTFFKTQEDNLDKHFHNDGRFNMSLADSSFDTWLDGYELGIPNRKVSIYIEGALCAFMLDVAILYKTQGKQSLRNLMNQLYLKFPLQGKGVSEEEYINLLISYGGEMAQNIVNNFMYGTQDYTPMLKYTFSLLGIDLHMENNSDFFADKLGIKGVKNSRGFLVQQVQINSISDKHKIAVGDLITKVNDQNIEANKLSRLGLNNEICLTIKRRFESIKVNFLLQKESYFLKSKILVKDKMTTSQKYLFEAWLSYSF